jgi:hypothetical protein
MTVSRPSDPTGGRLVAWAAGMDAAYQLGKALAATSFCPKHFQGKPAEAAAAVLFGDEIGLSPAQALRSIYVISGTPALYARTMVALVMSHGHQVWTVEDTPSRVTVAGRRLGSDHVEQVTWTVDRARRAGYTSNQKYQSDPQSMLYARAAGDVARRIAPDVIAGIAYTVEELEVAEPGPTTTVQRATPTRTVQRALVPVPDEPPLDDQPAPAAVPADTTADEGAVTDAQQRKLGAAMREQGITDRTKALAYVAGVIGRDVSSRKELTREEASRVIDALAEPPEPAPEPPDPPLPDPADGDDPWTGTS